MVGEVTELHYNKVMKRETIYKLANFICDLGESSMKLGLELEYIQLWSLSSELCDFAK